MDIILQKPIISEKSMKQAKSGWYTFLVNRGARKPVIAKAVEDQFGVNVTAVKTANFKDEVRFQRGKRKHFTISGYKKAIVSLKKGQKIGLFVAEEPAKVETAEGPQEVKEKKSLLKRTKVRIEKENKGEKK